MGFCTRLWAAVFAIARHVPFFTKRQAARSATVNEKATPLQCAVTNQTVLNTMRLGRANAAGTACEVVSVYNILLFAGTPQPLHTLLREAQENHLLMLHGFWGTDPFTLGHLLRLHGQESEMLASPPSELPPLGTWYIFSIWNRRTVFGGVHTFAAQSDGAGGYTAYNRYYGAAPQHFAAFGELLGNGRFLVGYQIL